MSIATSKVHLNNSRLRNGFTKLCDKCGEEKELDGGIQLNPTKWYCALCWIKRTSMKKK